MTTHAQPAPSAPGTTSVVAAFADRRTLVTLALGFSAGLPFLLVFDTLSAWMRASGLSLGVIGFFSLVTMIYAFKFLWAPLVDWTAIPLLTARVGHRRSWMLVCQGVIVLGLWLVSGTDPARNLFVVAMCAVLIAVASATQDVAIDAWRIEATEASKQGAMAAAYQWGYRVATLVAGAVPLLLADSYGWNVSYAVMAALMAVGVVGVLAAPPEAPRTTMPMLTDTVRHAPTLEAAEWAGRLAVLILGALLLGSGLTGQLTVLTRMLDAVGLSGIGEAALSIWRSNIGVVVHLLAVILGFGVVALAAIPMPGTGTRPGAYLSAALGDPLRDFIVRHGTTAWLVLALVCLYRIPDFVLNIMNPFYLDLGFTLVEIAEVRKVFGVAMTMVGVLAGGVAVARYGVMRAVVIGAFAGPLSNLVFVWLATRGHDLLALFLAIGIENIAGGFGGTCLIAYMSGLTSAGFTATQYALLSSFYAIPGRVLASQSGRIVEGAAKAADAGGVLAGLSGLFAGLPPESFAGALARSAVSPVALGTGYVTFFAYSALIGIVPIVLSFKLLRSQSRSSSR